MEILVLAKILHVWDGCFRIATPDLTYCNLPADEKSVDITEAMHHIDDKTTSICPDCAREIIKQLLKAME